MKRRGLLETALDDHAEAVALLAVAGRAEDVEAFPAAFEKCARDLQRQLVHEFPVGPIPAYIALSSRKNPRATVSGG